MGSGIIRFRDINVHKAGAYHDEYHVDENELYELIIRMFYEETDGKGIS